MITIRCNACGERSRIEAQRTSTIDTEIDAMTHIARALSALVSNESRARVLQWAAAHSSLEETGTHEEIDTHADGDTHEAADIHEPDDDLSVTMAPRQSCAADPKLGVHELDDLFSARTGVASAQRDTPSSLVRFVVGGDIRHRLRAGWLRA